MAARDGLTPGAPAPKTPVHPLDAASTDTIYFYKVNEDSENVRGRQRLRDRLREATVREILAATEEILVENGVEHATMAKIAERAGLGHWTPNELRHSAASLLSAAGVPLEEIADVLGHTSTRMLEQHYRHQVKPSIDAHVGAIESLFG